MNPSPQNLGHPLLNAVRWVENALLATLLGTMILLAAGNILLRNFFGGSPSWVEEMLRALVLWIGLVGASAAAREANHINIDLLSRFMPPKAKAFTKALASLFAVLVSAMIAWSGYNFVANERAYGALLLGEKVPAWTVQLIIPVVFILIAGRYLGHLLRNIQMTFGKGEE